MMNQLKMMKLVRLRIVVGFRRTEVSLRLARNYGHPLTIKILWSALSNYELGLALVNIGSLVSL
jgi:hypothetical protein